LLGCADSVKGSDFGNFDAIYREWRWTLDTKQYMEWAMKKGLSPVLKESTHSAPNKKTRQPHAS
jgi:hypothetical protein